MNENTFGTLLILFSIFCVAIPLLVGFFYSVFWAYQDAEKRGKSGCLVALLVFLVSWPAGLIIWLIFRPENKGSG